MVEISVIVPTYNCEAYIEKSINTLLNQTFKDIEVICIEDGSSDNTLDILNEMASSDSRLIIYAQENQGASVARNKALKLATGNYIYFFDADDYLVEDGLEKMYNNALNNNSDIVIFRFSYFQDNEFIRHDRNFDLENAFPDVDFNDFAFTWSDIKDYILRVNVFAPWFKLYKKEFLDRFDCFEFPPNLKHNDVPFQIETMLKSSSISFIPEFLYQYNRNNPNSITNNPSDNGNDIFSIVDIVENDVNTQEYMDLAKKELSSIDLENNELIKGVYLYRVQSILNSKTPEEYHAKQEIYNLNKKLKKLKRKNKKLIKKNQEILNSNSWKITKPLRLLVRSIKRK